MIEMTKDFGDFESRRGKYANLDSQYLPNTDNIDEDDSDDEDYNPYYDEDEFT